ncbi:MAG: chemotaxis response regulator protein-glutamate methylesterase [Desulfonatronovibrionaceae bacterium]
MIRVVVIDDSAFMRKAIGTMLDKDPEIQVVAYARDGEEGLEKIRAHDPHVVTLDIEMPRMDGLTALKHIMMEMPRPVLMVSSLTTEGAEATLKAMENGAVDFIPKQLSKVSLDIVKIEEDLLKKVKAIARRRVRPRAARPARARDKSAEPVRRRVIESSKRGKQIRDVVAFGVSTGGPPVVQRILSELPPDFPAGILIAQHMPKAFTGPFAKRLGESCRLKVKEAEVGDVFRPGCVYISPGGMHLTIEQKVSRIDVAVGEKPEDALYRPSVNVLMSSVAKAVGSRGLGVILTGMGSDGLLGIRDLKACGGKALAQSEESCVVYGMPMAIVDEGLADKVVPLEELAGEIASFLYN